MRGSIELDRRIERIKVELPMWASYHHHKEIMAHGCVGLEIGLFAWAMTPEGWKLLELGKNFVGFVIVWIVIHLYLRWQLRNRRKAAIYIREHLDYLREWSTDIRQQEQNCRSGRRLWFVVGAVCDFLIPCFRGTFADRRVRNEWMLYLGEWLATGISWALLLAGILRKYDLVEWLSETLTQKLCEG